MNYTGSELVQLKIVTNVEQENIQQHGVDLNLIKVERLIDSGLVPYQGKTLLAKRELVQPIDNVWSLQPGIYDITFAQGCHIPRDNMGLIRQRSSILRNGALINSSVFDAGFYTDNIGTMLVVIHPIQIETGARVAQFYTHKSNVVQNLYNGQFQNDNQRK